MCWKSSLSKIGWDRHRQLLQAQIHILGPLLARRWLTLATDLTFAVTPEVYDSDSEGSPPRQIVANAQPMYQIVRELNTYSSDHGNYKGEDEEEEEKGEEKADEEEVLNNPSEASEKEEEDNPKAQSMAAAKPRNAKPSPADAKPLPLRPHQVSTPLRPRQWRHQSQALPNQRPLRQSHCP